MSLPVGLSTVTVACGPYTDATGTPYGGVVTFTPSTPVSWSATGAVILAETITVTLDGTGSATVVLPATDATGLSVAGFTYRVAYTLTASDGTRTGYRYPYRIQLPHAAPTVVLENLAPVTASDGSTVSVTAVTSVAGLTGIVSGPALSSALGLGPAATLPITGTPTTGQVITATSGSAASWQTPSQGSAVSDATTSAKGIVQLAGDLAGTATAPTVPGLAGKAPTSRTVTAGTGLTGGGDLTADRTLAVSYGTTAGTAAQGNDSRITGALQAANNLSDVTAATARTNLGLGTASTQASTAFDAAGAAATAQSAATTAAQASSLQKSANLSDLASAATARTNLGLGSAATQATSAFDAAGAAATAQAASLQAASNLSDLTSAPTARTNLGAAGETTRTAVKTSSYTAAAGDLVPVDTTSGPVTITLPTAPADKSRVAVKLIIQGGTNTVTVARGGSDVLNKAGGSTSATLSVVNQGATFLYSASTAIWTVVSGDLPLTVLDARYDAAGAATTAQAASLQKTSNLSDLASAATARTNLGVGASVQVDTYDGRTTNTATWTTPTGAKSVRFQVWGSGGGGGSGRRGAAGTVRCGGGGAGGAGYVEETIPGASLPASLNVFVGASPAGGAAQTTNDTNGSNGTAGNSSAVTTAATVSTAISSGGLRILASGGASGNAGTASAGAGGAAGAGATNISGGTGGSASGTGGAGGNSGNIAALSAVGGGAGGGITAADAASVGGTPGVHTFVDVTTGSGAIGTDGPSGFSFPAGQMGGGGGGGGGSSITGAAGAGGAGGFPGGGGAGGGAALNGNNSGAGGAGGAGLVVITTYF